MEGKPRHEIVYGKLRGVVRKKDFVNTGAWFFDREGELIKQASLTDIRELGDGIYLAHRIEIQAAEGRGTSVLTLSDVRVNQSLPVEMFTEDALSRKQQ